MLTRDWKSSFWVRVKKNGPESCQGKGVRGNVSRDGRQPRLLWSTFHRIDINYPPKNTYSTRDSLVVTDPTTDLALTSFTRGERTGSRVLSRIWPYVLVGLQNRVDVCHSVNVIFSSTPLRIISCPISTSRIRLVNLIFPNRKVHKVGSLFFLHFYRNGNLGTTLYVSGGLGGKVRNIEGFRNGLLVIGEGSAQKPEVLVAISAKPQMASHRL